MSEVLLQRNAREGGLRHRRNLITQRAMTVVFARRRKRQDALKVMR